MELGRYGSRAILNPTFIDRKTGKPFLYMDYANAAENSWEGEVVYATGGDGSPRRIAFNGNKTSTLTFETQIFTLQHLAMLAGRDIESGVARNIFKTEVLKVESDGTGGKQVTLNKTPVNAASVTVFKFVNGIMGEEQTVDGVTQKVVTLADTATVNVGDEVQVFYQWTTSANGAHKLSFTTKDFPKDIKIVGDTVFADEVAGDVVSAQITYYRVKAQPNFTLNLSPSGDPTSLSIVFDVFPEKVNGVDTMADLVVYEDEEV